MKFVSPASLDFSNPSEWPIYYRVVFWALIAVVLFFAYGHFLRNDLLENQKDNQAKTESLLKDYKKLYQYTLDLPLYRNQANDLLRKLVESLAVLPTGTQMPSLIDNVSNLAQENNINFESFSPEKPRESGYQDPEKEKKSYVARPINFSTKTGFRNFINFGQNLSELERILQIKTVEIAFGKKNDQKLDISGQLVTYVYTTDIKPLLEGIEGLKYEEK